MARRTPSRARRIATVPPTRRAPAMIAPRPLRSSMRPSPYLGHYRSLAGSRRLRGLDGLDGGPNIGPAEITALKQQRFTHNFCEGVGEAVAKVQAPRKASPSAKFLVSFSANPCLLGLDWFDDDAHGFNELVEAPAKDWVPCSIGDYRRFEETTGRNLHELCVLDCPAKQRCLRLVIE